MAQKFGVEMASQEIRESFLSFFESRGHTRVASSSLVPLGDPTLLFTNAGMVQFKNVFLGLEKRSYVRATTAQKCVRAGGKHNDLDNVGFTGRHHTFFEMLGNFSFGDYFKEDAIKFAWDFLTNVLQLPKDRLYITVFREDDEAEELWKKIAGLPQSRIMRLGEKDNFWAMGDTGPCGPCSEIVIDRGEEFSCGPNCGIGKCDCDRFLELWNLVFMQYMRDEQGHMDRLPRPSIDTGMGLERIASILQGADTDFETDLFVPIIRKIEEISGKKQRVDAQVFPFRVIADHIRACAFLIADGVVPSNEGRGYVLRRILRRAVRFGQVLGIKEPFMAKLVPVVGSIMGSAYPELTARTAYIQSVISADEKRFLNTLEEGQKRVGELVSSALSSGSRVISGKDAFVLYDTYGFPIDLTKDIARENGLSVDVTGFEQAMAAQKERSRKARKDSSMKALELHELVEDVNPTVFTGYERLEDDCKVLAVISDTNRETEMEAGDEALVVFDRTPFYATSGGQESDTGEILLSVPGKPAEVVGTVNDVMKTPDGIIFHRVTARKGGIMVGQVVRCVVDKKRRAGLRRHHSATHLLHRALRNILGDHATQSGSLVQDSRLRFDFSHQAPLSSEEIKAVENEVNRMIMADIEVSTKEMSLDEAKALGAVALFGEKYGEVVRVVRMGDYSMELCGGTHVSRTGEIGQFRILSESSVAAGVRRIEAVAGEAALERSRAVENVLTEIASRLGVSIEEVPARVDQLLRERDILEAEVAHLRQHHRSSLARDLVQKASAIEEASNRKIVVTRQDRMDVDEMRSLGDELRGLGASVVILSSARNDKPFLLVMVNEEDAKAGIDAVKIVRKGAAVMGGSGGGRPHMAQAGGKDVSLLDKAASECAREAKRLMGEVFGRNS